MRKVDVSVALSSRRWLSDIFRKEKLLLPVSPEWRTQGYMQGGEVAGDLEMGSAAAISFLGAVIMWDSWGQFWTWEMETVSANERLLDRRKTGWGVKNALVVTGSGSEFPSWYFLTS